MRKDSKVLKKDPSRDLGQRCLGEGTARERALEQEPAWQEQEITSRQDWVRVLATKPEFDPQTTHSAGRKLTHSHIPTCTCPQTCMHTYPYTHHGLASEKKLKKAGQ